MVAQMWPQLVMEWRNDELSACGERLVNAPLDARCPHNEAIFATGGLSRTQQRRSFAPGVAIAAHPGPAASRRQIGCSS